MSKTVLFETNGPVAQLTLNRPEKLNALNYELIDLLMDHLEEIERRDDLRGVILTGAGEKAFSSGADIAGFEPDVRAGPDVALREIVRRGQAMTARIETFPKPILVAVNGLAYGGGSEITEAAPLALASDRASFCKAEIRLGFAPPFGGSQRLPRLIGRKRAMRMLLSGEPISAEAARDYGLVNEVVPHNRLMEEAYALMERITAHSPLAVAACLGSATRGINVPIDEGLAIEGGYFARMVPTHDMKEGVAAFLEKREPQFEGR
ncbi:crotonase/enoyl-CoA hydratase family protein [Nisaea acidiphila]|uniref:Crotonase/enoyl-CoA hydratase family protein n=1 Tax=Nisaea acidiphila TaxID=1862145 RepID=A0A9J7AR89_9PROT|nr:crotonase/enoyl-CoA hydratase family protein [Nisaea acidiphila]UUX49888.1 crotonase/enoyl-CoA hydratase family protein [Nisaea acidiphila]